MQNNLYAKEEPVLPRTSRLNEVMKIIEFHQKSRKENVEHFWNIWNNILTKLYADPVFKELYDGCDFVGNYGDGVKINKSNEYDFYFYLNIPDSENLEIKATKDISGAAEINIKKWLSESVAESHITSKLKEISDDQYFLTPTKVNTWIRKLFAANLPSPFLMESDGKQIQLIQAKHGSAHFFNVIMNGKKQFGINIYASFKINPKDHWIVERIPVGTSFWAAVAKKQKNSPRSFNCSYEKMERDLLGSIPQMKNALKLLMKIRDKDQLTPFKTHYLKTICLNVIDEGNLKDQETKVILMAIFRKLLNVCDTGKLLCFWDSKKDLVEPLMATMFQNRLQDALHQAFHKAADDEIPWAFCNKKERLYYYAIPKRLSYSRGHRRHFPFNRMGDTPIPKHLQDEVLEFYPPLYLK